MPDTLYIHDLHARRVIFSNHHLGQQLGYNQEELARMGENLKPRCAAARARRGTCGCNCACRKTPANGMR